MEDGEKGLPIPVAKGRVFVGLSIQMSTCDLKLPFPGILFSSP